jgi:hypothetical protein
MIDPIVRLFSGTDKPILSVLYRTEQALTVWLLVACEGDMDSVEVTQEQVTAVMNSHAVPLSPEDTAGGLLGKMVPGEFIASRLAGKYFIAQNRVCLDQNDGLSVAEWSDCAHFAFPTKENQLRSPENRYIATKDLKNSLTRLLQINGGFAWINLCVPFSAYNVDQGSLLLVCNPEYGVVANFALPSEMLPMSGISAAFALARPALTFTGPASISPDSYADVQLAVTSSSGAVQDDVTARVYVEVISGYSNKTRVDVTGQTTLRVAALGLVVGDVVHLKAGFKNFSGVAEIQIPVA